MLSERAPTIRADPKRSGKSRGGNDGGERQVHPRGGTVAASVRSTPGETLRDVSGVAARPATRKGSWPRSATSARPGARGWHQLRTRRTAEAVIGGVLGSLERPDGLVLGRYEGGRLPSPGPLGSEMRTAKSGVVALVMAGGVLLGAGFAAAAPPSSTPGGTGGGCKRMAKRVAGRTSPLPPSASTAIARLLRPPQEGHPCPAQLPSGRFGPTPGELIDYTPVEPEVVVEVETDTAFEHGRWRHAARFLRMRHDLSPLEATAESAWRPKGEREPPFARGASPSVLFLVIPAGHRRQRRLSGYHCLVWDWRHQPRDEGLSRATRYNGRRKPVAQRTVVTLLDDLDQSPADETVEFGLDGVTYEIDLSAQHAAALRDAFGDYIEHARRTGGRRRSAAASSPGGRSATRRDRGNGTGGSAPVDREQNQAIREWARKQGMTVSDRGRIPREVSDAYHRSHG